MPRLTKQELLGSEHGERSDVVRDRVQEARERQRHRYRTMGVACNAHLSGPLVRRHALLAPHAEELLASAVETLALTGRGFDRALKVARTVADLAGASQVEVEHLAEALSYREGFGRRVLPEPVDEAFAPAGWPDGFGEGREERRAIAVLASLRGISPRNLHRECWRLGSASAALAAIRSGRAGSDADREHALAADPDAIVAGTEAAGARFLSPCDEEYPSSVLELDDPPVAVFVRGARVDVPELRVAVVGARRCSALGAEIVRSISGAASAAPVSAS